MFLLPKDGVGRGVYYRHWHSGHFSAFWTQNELRVLGAQLRVCGRWDSGFVSIHWKGHVQRAESLVSRQRLRILWTDSPEPRFSYRVKETQFFAPKRLPRQSERDQHGLLAQNPLPSLRSESLLWRRLHSHRLRHQSEVASSSEKSKNKCQNQLLCCN